MAAEAAAVTEAVGTSDGIEVAGFAAEEDFVGGVEEAA